ncbi:MAG: hypothetical protein GXY58_06340 [Planctomycetaceae bacterium]|nr:hypothetical protein [Planctomycetaceae bacterium]
MNCSSILTSRSGLHGIPRRALRGPALGVRAGTTLLEVILAIAILGGSLAVLGELVRIGTRSAYAARVQSTAQLLADTLVAELAAGSTTPESTSGVVEAFGGFNWAYDVLVQQVDQQGLLALDVTVRENVDAAPHPISYRLVRWMIDPQTEYELEQAAAQAASTAGSTTSGATTGSSTVPATGTESGTGGTP